MNQVLLGLGSNIRPDYYLQQAAEALSQRFAGACFSRVYRSAAIGMDGDDFLNACCLLQTELSQQDVIAYCKQLEDRYFRDRSEGSWKPRTLDVDLIQWNGEVIGDDLHLYAHVYVPASELIDLMLPDQDYSTLQEVGLELNTGAAKTS